MTAAIALPPEIETLVREGAYFAVSGGKDGNIAAVVTNDELDRLGHPRERRIAVHSDLGIIEWLDSGRMCVEVADHMGVPLMVVRHKTHDMIGRWRQRFQLSLQRYADLRILHKGVKTGDYLCGPGENGGQKRPDCLRARDSC